MNFVVLWLFAQVFSTKLQYSQKKLSQSARFCHAKGWHAPKFFTNSRIFLPQKFPTIRYIQLKLSYEAINEDSESWFGLSWFGLLRFVLARVYMYMYYVSVPHRGSLCVSNKVHVTKVWQYSATNIVV